MISSSNATQEQIGDAVEFLAVHMEALIEVRESWLDYFHTGAMIVFLTISSVCEN